MMQERRNEFAHRAPCERAEPILFAAWLKRKGPALNEGMAKWRAGLQFRRRLGRCSGIQRYRVRLAQCSPLHQQPCWSQTPQEASTGVIPGPCADNQVRLGAVVAIVCLLLVAEGPDGVNTHGAPSRPRAGDERNGDPEERRGEEGDRVCGTEA